MGYSSAFDDLLARGRDEMDRMTGRTPAAPERTSPGPEPRQRGQTVEGTSQGIPFRLTVKPRPGDSR